MSYEYNNFSRDPNLYQIPDTSKSASKKEKDSDSPKTHDASQPAFEQLNFSYMNSPENESFRVEQYEEFPDDTSKAHHVSQPILKKEEITTTKSSRISIQEMDEDHLLEALENPENFTSTELSEIEARLELLMTNSADTLSEIEDEYMSDIEEFQLEQEEVLIKEEAVFIMEEDVLVKEEEVMVKEEEVMIKEEIEVKEELIAEVADIEADWTEEETKQLVENARYIDIDGVLRLPHPDVDHSELVSFNPYTGVLSGPQHLLSNYRKGQDISFEERNGNIVRKSIKKSKVMSANQLDKFKKALVVYLPQIFRKTEDLEKKDKDAQSIEGQNSYKEYTKTETTKEKSKNEVEHERDRMRFGEVSNVEINTIENFYKEFEKQQKYLKRKEDKIRKEIESHETLVEFIKANDLTAAYKEDHQQLINLKSENIKLDNQYKELVLIMDQKQGSISVPLETLEKCKELVIDFEKISQLILNGVSAKPEILEAFNEAIPVKKQIISVVGDMINLKGSILSEGKNSQNR